MRYTPVLVATLSIVFACRSNSGDGGIDAGSNGSNGNCPTIMQVQSDSMPPGTAVCLNNVVVTAVDTFGTRTGDFWVEDPAGGPFSGVLVFPPATALSMVQALNVGDIVSISGTVKDEFALTGSNGDMTGRTDTELDVPKGGALTLTKTGTGAVPAPSVVDANAIGQLFDPTQAKTNGGGAAFNAAWEMWEGVLVTMSNVDAFGAPKSFGSGGADQFDLDISGDARMEGALMDITASNIKVDTCMGTLTGVVDYFFEYLVYPRTAADFNTSGTGCVFENAANGSAACTDGVDNDGNGFTDCADLGCEVGTNAYLGTSCVGTSATTCGCSMNVAAGGGAAAVQAVTGTAKTAMILNDVFVTGVGTKGFWVADTATTTASGHGTFVFTGSAPPALTVGQKLSVQGLGEVFTPAGGTKTINELQDPTVVVAPTGANATAGVSVAVATATDLTNGAPYAGSLVELDGHFIVTAVTTHNMTMSDGTTTFTMSDEAFASFTGAVPTANECYSKITGVMDLTSGASQVRNINPRSAADMMVQHGGTVGASNCNP
jgi:hypothetical protein